MSPWPYPSFSKAKPKGSLTVWGNKSFLCIKPFSDLPTLSRHMWLAPAYLWYHLHATIPFAHCVLTTLAFFLILLPCQNYFYLLTYQNYFYLMFLLHMITSNDISWERLSFTLERSPSRMPFILLCPHYHSLKVSCSFICPYLWLLPIVWISSWCT